MKLSKIEKETVITFNEGDEKATVYTYNKKLQHKLDKLCISQEVAIVADYDQTGTKTYRVPKTWVRISPKKKINYTAEQRMAIAKRLSKK